MSHKKIEEKIDKAITKEFVEMVKSIEQVLGGVMTNLNTGQPFEVSNDMDAKAILEIKEQL